MTTVQELFNAASEAGFEELTVVEPGTYDLVLGANPTKNGGGIFVKGKVLTGPYTGKTIAGGTLTLDPTKATATSIALQNLGAMGITQEQLGTLGTQFGGINKAWTEAVAGLIKGRKVQAQIGHNHFGTEVRTQFEIGKIKLLEAPPAPAAAGVPAAAPVAVAAPVAAAPPAAPPAAPVTPAEPAPAPVEAAPVAPAPAAVPDGDPGF